MPDNDTQAGTGTGTGTGTSEVEEMDLAKALLALDDQKTTRRRFVRNLIDYRNRLSTAVETIEGTLTNYHHAFVNVSYGERLSMNNVIAQLEIWALKYQELDAYCPYIKFDLSDETMQYDGDKILAGNPEADLGYPLNVIGEPIPVKIGSIIRMPYIDTTWVMKEEHKFVGWSLNKSSSWSSGYFSSGFTTALELETLVSKVPEKAEFGPGTKGGTSDSSPVVTPSDTIETVTFKRPPDLFRIPWDTKSSDPEKGKKTTITFYPVFAPAVVAYTSYDDGSGTPPPIKNMEKS